MEQKTKISAEDGKQELIISREFELPVAKLFTAYIEPEIVEQWMGTKVLKLDAKKLGAYEFETTDAKGNKHLFCGVIHECERDKKITRTFEMVNTPFPVQLEFLTFEQISGDKSKLTMHIVYKSVTHRDNMLKLPFAYGINLAHNRIQDIVGKLI